MRRRLRRHERAREVEQVGGVSRRTGGGPGEELVVAGRWQGGCECVWRGEVVGCAVAGRGDAWRGNGGWVGEWAESRTRCLGGEGGRRFTCAGEAVAAA